jgi:hypothetical protein
MDFRFRFRIDSKGRGVPVLNRVNLLNHVTKPVTKPIVTNPNPLSKVFLRPFDWSIATAEEKKPVFASPSFGPSPYKEFMEWYIQEPVCLLFLCLLHAVSDVCYVRCLLGNCTLDTIEIEAVEIEAGQRETDQRETDQGESKAENRFWSR